MCTLFPKVSKGLFSVLLVQTLKDALKLWPSFADSIPSAVLVEWWIKASVKTPLLA